MSCVFAKCIVVFFALEVLDITAKQRERKYKKKTEKEDEKTGMRMTDGLKLYGNALFKVRVSSTFYMDSFFFFQKIISIKKEIKINNHQQSIILFNLI
jgi:thiosulfate reductase cytochrome b subunit